MIDFHILLRPNRTHFEDKAFDSLNRESLFVLEQNSNLAKARLEMFKLGTNEYVSYCDDDDRVKNLENVKEYLRNNNPNALYTNSHIIDHEDNIIGMEYPRSHVWDKNNFWNVNSKYIN